MFGKILRLTLCLVLSLMPAADAARAWDNDYATSFRDPARFNTLDVQRNLDSLRANRPNLLQPPTVRPFLPAFEVPDFQINRFGVTQPDVRVRGVGDEALAVRWDSSNFNRDIKLYDGARATLQVEGADGTRRGAVQFELSAVKFAEGAQTPRAATRVYRDEAGTVLKVERSAQAAQVNPSHENFRRYYEAPANAALDRPAAPSLELPTQFSERWTVQTQDADGGPRTERVRLDVRNIKHDSPLHRTVSAYDGSLRGPAGTIDFSVRAETNKAGDTTGLTVTLGARGAPTATIQWTAESGKDGAAAHKLLSENLPVPLLIGPRTSTRLNDVDLPEAPVRFTAEGTLSPKQLGDAKDLANLMGREDLGITVTFAPPAADAPKGGFSIGNALRNLWYGLTGRGAEVSSLRQQLTALRDEKPGEFVLAAGFNDPSFMGVTDLRAAIARSNDLKLPNTSGPETTAPNPSVVKIDGETFYRDPTGEMTNIAVFDQKLQRIEVAADQLGNKSNRLMAGLSVSMDVTNVYLNNLHAVTGQRLTAVVEMTDALAVHSARVADFKQKADAYRSAFETENFGALQKNLPGLHDQQMNLKAEEKTLVAQAESLQNFTEKLGALTKEVKDFLPKVDFDKMLSASVTDTTLKAVSETYFQDDKTILSAKANELVDSIAGLAEKGLIDRETAKEWASGIINARDRFCVAVPRMGYGLEKTVDQLKDPIGEMSYAMNRKADALFFERWNQMAEKDPEGMAAFATKGLWTARALNWTSSAVGLGTGIYFAPVATILTIGTGVAATEGLKSMGVKDTVAEFYGIVLGAAVGSAATSPKITVFVREAAGIAGALLDRAGRMFRVPRTFGRLLANERGGVLLPGRPAAEVPAPARISKQLPGPTLEGRAAKNFDDALYTTRQLASDTPMYRYHGVNNRTGGKYSWFVDRKFSSESALRKSLAIRDDWGVEITKMTEFRVPKGTWISEGKAAAQGPGYPGGGYQAVIREVPNSWVIRTDKAFQ